jgi:hypothetical protein
MFTAPSSLMIGEGHHRNMQLRRNLFTLTRRFAEGNGPTPRVINERIVLARHVSFDPEPPAHQDQSERNSDHERGEGRHRIGR